MQKSGAKSNAKVLSNKPDTMHGILICKSCGHSIYLGNWVKLDIQCCKCGTKIRGGDKDG